MIPELIAWSTRAAHAAFLLRVSLEGGHVAGAAYDARSLGRVMRQLRKLAAGPCREDDQAVLRAADRP